MAALDRDPVEAEIGKAGIERARRVTRGKAREQARIGNRLGPPDQGQPRPVERVGMALGAVEQQRDARVEGDVAAVLGEVGQQQQRARVEIGGDQHQRGIGCAAQAGGECRALAASHQPAPEPRRIAARFSIAHCPNQRQRRGGVKSSLDRERGQPANLARYYITWIVWVGRCRQMAIFNRDSIRSGPVPACCKLSGGCNKWRTRLLSSMTTATS